VPASQELVHVEHVVGGDRRALGQGRIGQPALGKDESEGRAATCRAVDPKEGDVLAGRQDSDTVEGDRLLADGAGDAVRERGEVIQRIHPRGVYPFARSDAEVVSYTPGEYHRSVTTPREAPTGADTFRHAYTRDKAQLVRRLARIEGQVRGISRMIEREEYCVDILQQTSALRAAVDSLAILVLEDHVQGCVRTAAENGDAERYVDEVVDVVRRTLGRPVRSTARS
jgi:DNA-binding FrmR family transcriptional regulator